MRNTKYIIMLSLFTLIFSSAFARDTDQNTKNNKSRKKALELTGSLEINNVKAAIANNGWLFWAGDASGFIIPHPVFSSNKSEQATIFASGLWLSGSLNGVTRAAVANYTVDFTPGDYDLYKQDPVKYNQEYSDFLVYYYFAPEHIEYLKNLAETSENQDVVTWANAQLEIANTHATLWVNKAVPQGAPLVPPGHGASYTIYHDADVQNRINSGGNSDNTPMNVQIRQLAWAYRTAGPLNNTVFLKWEIINKNTSILKDMYATVWADPDLGDFLDDYVGSDPSLGLGYCYNGKPVDKGYTGTLGIDPPAVGYDFLQGPIVTSVGSKIIKRGANFAVYINYTSAADVLDGDIIINDKKVLSATSFVYFNNSSTESPNAPSDYNTMAKGNNKSGGLGADQISALATGKTTLANQLWWFNGDPEQRTGWIETASPSDRRYMLNVGPFDLGVSDSTSIYGDPGYQSIVFGAFTSFGKSNRNSVTLLKFEDKIIQSTFNAAFEVLPTVPAPSVTYRAVDQKLALNWASSSITYKGQTLSTESYDLGGWKFEGYQLVQFANSNTAGSDNFKTIAVYDLVNGIAALKNFVVDDQTGDILLKTVIKAVDSDIKNDVIITRDVYSGLTTQPLYNNQAYAFGLRGYAYNPNPPEGQPYVKFGEWASGIEAITPQSIQTSNSVKADYNQILESTNVLNDGTDGQIQARVVDPFVLADATYQVKFSKLNVAKTHLGYSTTNLIPAGTIVWSLYKNGVLVRELSDMPQAASVEQFGYTRTYDGIAWTVNGPSLNFKSLQVTKNGTNVPFAAPHPGAFGFQGFPTPVSTADNGDGTYNPVAGVQQTNQARWGLHTATTGYKTYTEFVARCVLGRANQWKYLIPNNFEIRFEAGKAREFTSDVLMDVPFQIWDVSLDVQLCPRVIDDNSSGTYDFSDAGSGPQDHEVSGGTDDPFTERIYIMHPKSLTATGYSDWVTDGANVGPEIMGRLGIVNWNGGDVAGGVFNSRMPELHTVFRMNTTKPNLATTVLSVTSPGKALLRKNTLAAKNIDEINVVPNPYYGRHDQEGKNDKFIKFINLPQSKDQTDVANDTKINIYNLAGDLVKNLVHNSVGTTTKWQLTNNAGNVVGAGVYIAHITLPTGNVKIIKMVVLQSIQLISTF